MDYPERLTTPRLALRRWLACDAAGIGAVWREPEVWGALRPDRPIPDDLAIEWAIERHAQHWEEHGFGLWVVELLHIPGEIAGWVGASHPTYIPELADHVEIGWALRPSLWGLGYASEGARSALEVAFAHLGCDSVLSVVDPRNTRSRAVAERLGMRHWRDIRLHDRRRPLGVYAIAESPSNSTPTPGSSPGESAM
jgi:RimJ/RimL family protein N-acetyltransferase